MGCCASVEEDSDYPYDSTWESDDDVQEKPSSTKQNKSKNSHQRQRPPKGTSTQNQWHGGLHTWRASRNLQCAKDMQCYRHRCWVRRLSETKCHRLYGCFNQKRDFRSPAPPLDCTKRKRGESEPLRNKVRNKVRGKMDNLPNLQFYQNKKQFLPDGVTIEEIHRNWYGDFQKLENVHTFIQWLFPLEEQGVNPYATPLTETEIKLFQEDENVKRNLLKSYKLMLHFYGIKLLNEKTGEVDRRRNWKERFENLNRNSHNNLRITRILKCLGLLGFSHYQQPLVRFFLYETLVRKTLPQMKKSVLDYFMFTVLDKKKRRELIEFAFYHFDPKEDFVWCPEKIKKKLFQDFHRANTIIQT